MRKCAKAEVRNTMKAVGIVGSPRLGGNTEIITTHCLKAIAEEGIETELVRLAGLKISGCIDCGYCRDHQGECSVKDDMQAVRARMVEADAIIIGTPVYFGAATALVRGMMERAAFCERGAFTGKVGGPLVVARRGGTNFTFAELMFWFHLNGFTTPGGTYWGMAIGREKGDVKKDEEGMMTAWNFGKNVAKLTKKLRK
jgi:multimeric flavodoxin WrbA